ncbi:MAG TPA: glycosyltransferase family 2 protein [Acidimicrobiales bacterium]
MSDLLGSVVIPAYNEGAVIRRCLDRVFTGLHPHEVEVVVACNGCTDDTVLQAKESGYPITILDLPEPNKAGALRAAERAVTALPRVYLDADVEVTGDTLRTVLSALAEGAVAARPPLRYDTSRSTWLVRRYYAARAALPGVMSELCSAGVYGFSETARARFDEFADITADDLFAARIVAPDEVVVVDSPPVIVHTPRDSRSLIRILKRVYRGNEQLAAARPDLARSTTAGTLRDLLALARRPHHTLDAIVYALFVIAARVLGRVDRAPVRWERDDSSRV